MTTLSKKERGFIVKQIRQEVVNWVNLNLIIYLKPKHQNPSNLPNKLNISFLDFYDILPNYLTFKSFKLKFRAESADIEQCWELFIIRSKAEYLLETYLKFQVNYNTYSSSKFHNTY